MNGLFAVIGLSGWIIIVGLILVIGGGGTVVWYYRRKLRNVQTPGRVHNVVPPETLIQSITDGIVVVDPQGTISLMNPAASMMTEWPIEEALGLDVRSVARLAQEDEKELEPGTDPFSLVLKTRQQLSHIFQLNGRNDKKLIVSMVISPILISNTKEIAGVVAVFRDISKEHGEEKQRAEFISTASHEMRTPVAAIEGYLALALNERVSKIDPKARGFLEKAHASTQALGKLFQDLLTSAKAEDGRLSSHPIVVEMGAYMEQLTEDLRFAAQKKGLLIEFIMGSSEIPQQPDSVSKMVRPLYYTYTDPDRMREVVTNLFDNAVKYTETGKISIGLTGNEEVVQFYIKDTGSGIPSEDIPHLFQKFYRVDNSSTRTIGGTGLGLFICRKIVELYKGRIWVESQAGHGTIFFINLPRLSAARAAELQSVEMIGTVPPPITSLTSS